MRKKKIPKQANNEATTVSYTRQRPICRFNATHSLATGRTVARTAACGTSGWTHCAAQPPTVCERASERASVSRASQPIIKKKTKLTLAPATAARSAQRLNKAASHLPEVEGERESWSVRLRSTARVVRLKKEKKKKKLLPPPKGKSWSGDAPAAGRPSAAGPGEQANAT